jgi:hypothetical protein
MNSSLGLQDTALAACKDLTWPSQPVLLRRGRFFEAIHGRAP